MKNGVKRIISVLFLLCLIFSVVACSSPKSLARQAYKLEKQVEEVDDENKLMSILAKYEKLEEQYEKLSEADQKIYDAEYERLSEGD